MLPAGSLSVFLSFRTPPKNRGSRGLKEDYETGSVTHLHQKHERASGAFSRGSFTSRIPSPSAEDPREPHPAMADLTPELRVVSIWRNATGIQSGDRRVTLPAAQATIRKTNTVQPHPMEGTTSAASEAPSWPPQRPHLRPRPQ